MNHAIIAAQEKIIQESADPSERAAAFVELARHYGQIPGGMAKAFAYAEQAARLDSPDGYLEVARILGSACIESKDPAAKIEYAKNVCGICDFATLERFRRPDIACTAGFICEYLADFAAVNKAPPQFQIYWKDLANNYYLLALRFPVAEPSDSDWKAYEVAASGMERLLMPASERPAFNPAFVLSYFRQPKL